LGIPGDLPNPYFGASSGAPVLLDSFVVFLDALGTRKWASDPEVAQGRLNQLYNAWRDAELVFHIELDDLAQWRRITFTDNVLFGFPIAQGSDLSAEFVQAVYIVAMYQLVLAIGDVFSRGGMVRGALSITDHFAFGPGLNQAYALETGFAVHPRTILDKSSSDLARAGHRRILSGPDELCVDAIQAPDGVDFINYLSATHDAYNPTDLLAEHREAVRRGLSSSRSDAKVFDKFVWLAKYHNYFCATHHPGKPSLAIALDDEGMGFKSYH
jgi:hypothetical protein